MKSGMTLRLILGDQLNTQHSWFRQVREDILYTLMEVRQETDVVRPHIQKVAGFFSAMRHFADDLARIQATIARSQSNSGEAVGIEQLEGFVRQILGWREYMRGIYWAHMPEYASMNHFGHSARLPDYYWTADTHMNCLHRVISQSLAHAYAHHIQRLMITGNFALLAGIHPDEVDQWYLGIYIDAVHWVEIVNTRGMSQYADGGLVATKPYISSANYIRKMSDYCQDCHYHWRKPVGDRACPFNSLYWAFIHRHRQLLAGNPRVAMMVRTWDRMQASGMTCWPRPNDTNPCGTTSDGQIPRTMGGLTY